MIKEDIRDTSGPNGGLTGNLDGFARLWATSDNEVDISDREGLIRRAKELSTSGIISLKENECQALRRLTIPIFPVPLRVLSENHIWTLCAMTSDVRRHETKPQGAEAQSAPPASMRLRSLYPEAPAPSAFSR